MRQIVFSDSACIVVEQSSFWKEAFEKVLRSLRRSWSRRKGLCIIGLRMSASAVM